MFTASGLPWVPMTPAPAPGALFLSDLPLGWGMPGTVNAADLTLQSVGGGRVVCRMQGLEVRDQVTMHQIP